MSKKHTPAEVVAVLTQARYKIKSGWCKQHEALNSKRNPVRPEAVKWCMLGSVKAVTPSRTLRRLAIKATLYNLNPAGDRSIRV